MPDYKEMYLTITRAANKALKLNQEAMEHIITAQQQGKIQALRAMARRRALRSSTGGAAGSVSGVRGRNALHSFVPLRSARATA